MVGTTLVRMAINVMKSQNADEIVLETEHTNVGALSLYQNLGFIRDKRLYRYYLNGVDAFRLKLFCRDGVASGAENDNNLNRNQASTSTKENDSCLNSSNIRN
ncbi:7755_t:CDS:2 [Ambispora gerdemannii]|uniref:7755_t:CDS:1 n=1 Tax=Ambispora gerdemannii TaxID=144530 RepID=A0A9N8WK98_9GLOM|nr:7755_t:CDS:2 [Ambispora gerdemannii]